MEGERNPADIGYPVVSVSHGAQDGTDQVLAYTRREPASALTMAVTLGFLVGLSVAIGGVAAGWFVEQKRKRNFMSRLADLSSRTGLRDWAGR